MRSPGRTPARTALILARNAGIALVALELLYLLAANLALSTGLVSRALSGNPEAILVSHGRARTWWPFRVDLSDFSMRMQDRNIEFHLTVAHVRLDVHPLALLRREFHGDHVRCEGVRFRFVHKVRDASGIEGRLAAYPPVPGLARPALLQVPPPPEPTPEEIAALWRVRLDDVDADVRELWFLEYRWEGTGRVVGGFELAPLRRLRVGPAELTLSGGELRAGRHLVAKDLHLRVDATVGPFDVQTFRGARVFRPITARVQLEAKGLSPALLDLYVPNLSAQGAGSLVADVRVAAGRLGKGTRMMLKLERASAELEGFAYQGSPQLTASLDGDDEPGRLRARATVPGSVVVPVPHGGLARVDLTGLHADITLSGDDLAEGLSLEKISSRLKEGRVLDASAIRSAIAGSTSLPFVSPLLGDGPLVTSGGVDRTPEVTIARLRQARLGGAELHGAVRTSRGSWDGALAGHVGFVPIGLRLKAGKPEVALFVSDGWLNAELAGAGIRFEEPPHGPLVSRPE